MRAPTTRVEDLHRIRRWTEEEGALAVEAWQASGLELAAFAEKYRLHPVRVARWLRRRPARPEGRLPALMPVTVVAAEAPTVSRVGTVEIALVAGTRVVRVPVPMVLGEAELAGLVRAVEAA